MYICAESKYSPFDHIPSMDQIAMEITIGQVMEWTKKSGISKGSLSVKYAMLNIVSETNWAPTNHKSSITSALTKLIFQIGTKAK